MEKRRLTRRDFLRVSAAAATAAALAACQPAAPQVIEVEKEVPVEKEVIKEVPVEKQVVVEKEVEKIVTPTPAGTPVIRWQYDGGGVYQTAAEQSADRFNEDHPNITLLIEPRPPNVFEKLMASMVAGVAPDIFEYWGLWFAKLHQKGQLVDVQPLVDATMTEEDIADFVPGEWENFARLSFKPGVRVAMPRYINWMWLHYNKDALDEAGVDYPDKGWTVDDMADAALRLTKRKADGTPEQFGMNFPAWSMERLFYHLERFGGAFVHHDEPKKCLMGTPESQEALEWLRKRYWEDGSWAEPLLTDRSWGGSVYTNAFAAMIEDGGPYFQWRRDTLGLFDIDFTHPPKGPKDFYGLSAEGRTSYQVTDGYGMWSGGKWLDATWEVMRYLAGPVNQEIRMRNVGRMAVRMSVMEHYKEAMIDIEPSMADMSLDVVLEAFEMGYGRDDERFFCQAEAEEIINPLLEKVYIIGDTPVSVLADACADVEAVQTCEAI
jgi:ABC-type glycerol-3-phosphate transport system substrate-binding protein